MARGRSVGAATQLDTFDTDRSFVTSLALRVCAPIDQRLERASRERVDSGIESFAELYDGLLGIYGRRVRAPFTLEHFTTMLAALAEGFVLHRMSGVELAVVDIEQADPEVGSEWTLFAAAAEAIVERFTEPDV